MKRKRILLLDNESALRRILGDELQAEGYETLPMESKHQGYDILTQWRPDMILSDIKSPNMDGWQFLKWVRANPFASRVRFIFVTGFADLKNALKASRLGANDFVSKPYDLRDLFKTIEREFATQEEPVWDLSGLTNAVNSGESLHTLPWLEITKRWRKALRGSPYRTGVLGVSRWKLDFVVDGGGSLLVGRLCRPLDPLVQYSAERYDSVLDGYGVEKGLFYVLTPTSGHINNSSRSVIASQDETAEIFTTSIFAPDLNRFEV